jgi:cytochrome c biogenesis protein CcmG/thiol:disulfide interchange protein DsbE
MNRTVLIIGLVIAAALVGILFLGLGKNPNAIRSPLVGRPAPAFALREVGTGQTIDVAQFKGKPVVINFWATWCGPCWEEHPTLVATSRQYAGSVQFVGVVFQDTEDKILSFLNQRGSSYPTLVDQAGKTAIAYGVGGVPETFFLDRNGVIVAKHDGPIDPDTLQAAAGALGLPLRLLPAGANAHQPGDLPLLAVTNPVPALPGSPDPRNAGAVVAALHAGAQACLDGTLHGLVTGPVHKATINAGGIAYSGTTELLTAKSATPSRLKSATVRLLGPCPTCASGSVCTTLKEPSAALRSTDTV